MTMLTLDDLESSEEAILERAKAGEWARPLEFVDGQERQPVIRAAFLRQLLLQQFSGVVIAMPGVRVSGVRVAGELDLSDCAGPQGGLPALHLQDCDLPDPILIGGAHLSRLSIENSRFRAVYGRGVRIDGDFSISGARPFDHEDKTSAHAEVLLAGARIGGDFLASGASLRTQVGLFCLNLQTATIGGYVALDRGFQAEGWVWLQGVKITGNLQLSGARLSNMGRSALTAANSSIGGSLIMDQADGAAFTAEGSLLFTGAHIERSVSLAGDIAGGSLQPSGGPMYSLLLDQARIEGSVSLSGTTEKPCDIQGIISFSGTRIGRSFNISHCKVSGSQGSDLVLVNALIGGQLTAFANQFNGVVSLSGARVHRLSDDPETGWRGASRIDLDELAYDHIVVQTDAPVIWRTRAAWLRRNVGSVQLGIVRMPSGRFSNQPWRACISALERAGLVRDARRLSREEQREANRYRGYAYSVVRQVWSADQRGEFIRWFSEVGNGQSFDSENYTESVLMLWRLRPLSMLRVTLVGLLIWPFAKVYAKIKQFGVWLFAEQFFGYGLSATRAAITSLLVWLIGTIGAGYALERGALVQERHNATGPCQTLSPALYAADLAIPILDLQQENICMPGRTEEAALKEGFSVAVFNYRFRVFDELEIWRWAVALYSILGAAVIGFSILTWSGVFRPRS